MNAQAQRVDVFRKGALVQTTTLFADDLIRYGEVTASNKTSVTIRWAFECKCRLKRDRALPLAVTLAADQAQARKVMDYVDGLRFARVSGGAK